MLPAIPAAPSVALSENDRRFILQRRDRCLAERVQVRRIWTERALLAVCLTVWSINILHVIGGSL